MITAEIGTKVGVSASEADFPTFEARTKPLRYSGKSAGALFSDYAVAAAMLASGTSPVLVSGEAEHTFPMSPVTGLVERFSKSSTAIKPSEVINDDALLQIARKQPLRMKAARPELSESVAKLIRAPYVSQVSAALRRMEEVVGEPRCAIHVEKLLNAIQTLSDVSPYDPFVRILLAFYDSLAFENRWNSYSKEQYEQARRVLEHAAQRGFLNDSGVNKIIMELELAGFSTLPFEVDYTEEA